MRDSLRKSLYLTKKLKPHLATPLVTFFYDNKNNFKNIQNEMNKSIDVFAALGSDFSTILKELSDSYDYFLLDKVSAIYLVNKKYASVCLVNSTQNKNEKHTFLIVNLDSVVAEYYKNSNSNGIYFTFGFISGIFATSALVTLTFAGFMRRFHN